MAAAIAFFVALEAGAGDAFCRLGLFAAFWRGALIPVLRIVTVVYVATKSVNATEPGANANKGSAIKPFRAVVAGGSAIIRSVIIVSVWAVWGCSNGDGDLSRSLGGGHCEAKSGKSDKQQNLESAHSCTSLLSVEDSKNG